MSSCQHIQVALEGAGIILSAQFNPAGAKMTQIMIDQLEDATTDLDLTIDALEVIEGE